MSSKKKLDGRCSEKKFIVDGLRTKLSLCSINLTPSQTPTCKCKHLTRYSNFFLAQNSCPKNKIHVLHQAYYKLISVVESLATGVITYLTSTHQKYNQKTKIDLIFIT